MKNFIYIFTLILCVIVSSVNAQNVNVSKSTNIVLSHGFHKVANVIEDIDTEDIYVRNIAMMQEEVSPETPETNVARNYEGVNTKY